MQCRIRQAFLPSIWAPGRPQIAPAAPAREGRISFFGRDLRRRSRASHFLHKALRSSSATASPKSPDASAAGACAVGAAQGLAGGHRRAGHSRSGGRSARPERVGFLNAGKKARSLRHDRRSMRPRIRPAPAAGLASRRSARPSSRRRSACADCAFALPAIAFRPGR